MPILPPLVGELYDDWAGRLADKDQFWDLEIEYYGWGATPDQLPKLFLAEAKRREIVFDQAALTKKFTGKTLVKQISNSYLPGGYKKTVVLEP